MNHIEKAVDACYELFSKMLSIIMAALPTFVFLAIFSEVVFGSLLDMTNITGDIVTVAELEQREKSYETISYK